jgi:hypothetical protein
MAPAHPTSCQAAILYIPSGVKHRASEYTSASAWPGTLWTVVGVDSDPGVETVTRNSLVEFESEAATNDADLIYLDPKWIKSLAKDVRFVLAAFRANATLV